MDPGSTLIAGAFLLILGSALAYLVLLFIIHGFTYRTWIFHGGVGAGMAGAVVGWLLGGPGALAVLAEVLGIAWFVVARRELAIRGSARLNVRPGDPLPPFGATTADGRRFTEADVVGSAPALLSLYRGWWCPSSKVQLDQITALHEQLRSTGVSIIAGSVDGPAEAAPLQEHVGDRAVILSDIPVSFLDALGVRDTRGAPWYDRLWFGAKKRDIAMPAVLLVDAGGRIRYAHRSTRVDEAPRLSEILGSL